MPPPPLALEQEVGVARAREAAAAERAEDHSRRREASEVANAARGAELDAARAPLVSAEAAGARAQQALDHATAELGRLGVAMEAAHAEREAQRGAAATAGAALGVARAEAALLQVLLPLPPSLSLPPSLPPALPPSRSSRCVSPSLPV